jgi:hypothetical protein
MTLLDIIPKIHEGERVTIFGAGVFVNRSAPGAILASEVFNSKLAAKEVEHISIGHLRDLVIRIKE